MSKATGDAMLDTYFAKHKKAGKSDEWLKSWAAKFLEVGRKMYPDTSPVKNNTPVQDPWD